FDHHEAVMVIYAIQADLFLLAYWMRYESDLAILGVVSAFFLGAIGLLQWAARQHWRLRSSSAKKIESPLSRLISVLREPRFLPRWSYLAVAIAVWAYALIVAAKTAEISSDVRFLLIALLALSVLWLAVLRAKPLSTVEKA